MTDTSKLTNSGHSKTMARQLYNNTKKPQTNYFTQTTTSSSHSNEKLFRSLRELYSKLRDVELDKSKFYPNIIITGNKKSGKSSMIEYILGMDLFPRSYFLNSNKKKPIKVEIIRHNLLAEAASLEISQISPIKSIAYQDDLFSSIKTVDKIDINSKFRETREFRESRELREFKFKLTLNDQMTFNDFPDFQEYINQSIVDFTPGNNYDESSKENFTCIKIEIFTNTPKNLNQSDYKDDFFFDCTLYEIDLPLLLSGEINEYLPSDNILYIICSALDNKQNIHQTLQDVKQLADNFEKCLLALTKPDRIESQRDLTEIEEILKKENFPQSCFVKMRTDEERHACPKIFEFYQNYEKKFYEEKYFLKSDNIKSKCGLDNIMNFLSNNIIIQFSKNFAINQKLIHEKFDSCLEEMQHLGGEIPTDEASKLEILKILFKNYVIKYAREMMNFYSNILTQFIKKNIYNLHHQDNENLDNFEFFDENKFGITRELSKCLKMKNINQNILNSLYNSNSNSKDSFMGLLPKKDLENLFFSISKRILEQEIMKINSIFEANLEMNKQYLYTKVSSIFTLFSSSLDEILSEKFNELFDIQKTEMTNSLDVILDIELNSEFIKDQSFYEKFIQEYKQFLSKGISSKQCLEEFYVKYISQISKEKLYTVMEMYCKFYSMKFYSSLNKKLITLTIENLINDDNLLKQELQSLNEDEEHRKLRNLLKDELGNLLKICEFTIKSYSLVSNLNLMGASTSSNTNLNSSMISFNTAMMTKTPELREMKNKYDKFFSRKLEDKFILDINDNLGENKYDELEVDLIDYIDLHDHFKFSPRNENKNFESIQNEVCDDDKIVSNSEKESELVLEFTTHIDEFSQNQNPIQNINTDTNINPQINNEKPLPVSSPISTESSQRNIYTNEINLVKSTTIEKNETSTINIHSSPLVFNSRKRQSEYVMVWDNTCEISVYNFKNNKIHQERVPDVPYEHFLEDNRYVNVNSSVFIAGGLRYQQKQRIFMRLDRPKNVLMLLDYIPEAVVRHSMIYLNTQNAIVLTGGKGTRMSFIYNCSTQKWEKFGELKTERHDATLFLMNDSLLFCFAGVKEQNLKNEDFILEYKNLNVPSFTTESWTSLKIKPDQPDQIDLIPKIAGICGFGTIPMNNNKLLLLGGYESEGFSDQEKAYQIKINQQSSELVYLSIEQVDICHAKDIQSWFPENNFVKFVVKEENSNEINNIVNGDPNESESRKFVNFNVDGEIVEFDPENLKLDVIPSTYQQIN